MKIIFCEFILDININEFFILLRLFFNCLFIHFSNNLLIFYQKNEIFVLKIHFSKKTINLKIIIKEKILIFVIFFLYRLIIIKENK